MPDGANAGETATLTSIQRLGGFFDEVTSAGGKIVPAQTVCNYWNYWFQYLPEHFSGREPVRARRAPDRPGRPRPGDARRVPAQPADRLRRLPARRALLGLLRRPGDAGHQGRARRDLRSDRARRSADVGRGRRRSSSRSSTAAPTAPSGTEAAPNCQAGQYGSPDGRAALARADAATSPGLRRSATSPRPLGVPPFGRTDLFLTQNRTTASSGTRHDPTDDKRRLSNFQIGLIAIVVTVFGFYLAFTKSLPF